MAPISTGTSPRTGPRRARPWRIVALIAALVLAAGAGAAWARFRRTAEGITLLGTGKQRADLCRAVPSLSPRRRQWVLHRLLNDPLETVRISAIAAVGRSDPDAALDGVVEGMLRSPDSSSDIRIKSGEMLLARRPPRPSVVDYLREACGDVDFRHRHPLLVARLAEHRLPQATEAERAAMLARCLDPAEPAAEHLRMLVRDNVAAFRPHRERLIDVLDEDAPFEVRQFVLSCLAAMDGVMRGLAAEDWRERPVVVAVVDDAPAVMEAEWVQEIHPNYQIQEFEGNLCLALGEGAGGYMHWLKGRNATIDIGTARFSMYAPNDGRYQLWMRTYMDDKCGNSCGIWLGGRQYQNFEDKAATLGGWHWKPLSPRRPIQLRKGVHQGRIEATEDGMYIDKLALLPYELRPDDVPPAVRWDPSLRSSLSFAVEWQAQPRGTTQDVTVWVRRSTADLTGGPVTLTVPEPFRIDGPASHEVRFAEGDPLGRTTFRVHLPADAVAGEDFMRARYEDAGGEVIEGQLILAAQLDWLTTGPLSSHDERHRALRRTGTLTDADLAEGWSLFPVKGYDPYRRLDMERAYGELQDRYFYLCTDIEVERPDTYFAYMTVDDTAWIYIDGRPVLVQQEEGPGEGRMLSRRIELSEGVHRIFVRLYQSALAERSGPSARYQTPNHCNIKLLLRNGRHNPAPTLRGLPWTVVRPDGD